MYKYVNGKEAITDEIIAFLLQIYEPLVLRVAQVRNSTEMPVLLRLFAL